MTIVDAILRSWFKRAARAAAKCADSVEPVAPESARLKNNFVAIEMFFVALSREE